MLGFGSSVRLTDVGTRDGLVRGELGRYRWEVRLARGAVSYGLHPETLYKGAGRIARLVLYEGIAGSAVQRKVALFDRGWVFGRREHLPAIRRVAEYLSRS